MSMRRAGGGPRKKSSLKKPAWDDSVHDLTVYKATPHEILTRKESHKSKNHMSVKLEKMRAERPSSKLSGADLQKLAIMKEVLYDQHQLQQVLAKSDSMMAVVKDMFGDDPKRSVAFPNVTSAPQSDSASTSLVNLPPDIYTRSEKLSDSVMNQSAINDIQLSDSEEDEDDTERPEPISYKSKLNLQRFHQYLHEEERKSDHLEPQTLISQHANNDNRNKPSSEPSKSNESRDELAVDVERLKLIQMLLEQKKLDPELSQNPQLLNLLLGNVAANCSSNSTQSDFKTPPRHEQPPQFVKGNGSPQSAINDTQKVKKTKKQVHGSPPTEANTNTSNNSSMTDMRQALKDLETELASYEHMTGRVTYGDQNKPESFSGYTVALVSAVSRMTKYLKETDLRLRSEMTLREQLTQDVFQLRAIIDALATDLIMTQEEYAKLFSESQRYKETTASEIASLNKKTLELQTVVSSLLPGHRWTGANTNNSRHSQCLEPQDGVETINTSRKSQESRTSTPNTTAQPGPSQESEPCESGAVLLSPLVRKTRVHSTNNSMIASKRQTSLVDVSDLAVSTSSNQSTNDPPQLTQAPPVMKSISVPRPISLVQSNLPVPLPPSSSTAAEQQTALSSSNSISAGHNNGRTVQHQGSSSLMQMQGGESRNGLANQLHELSVEEALQDPALQNLMQIQIAELNRQQEEATQRLRDLLDHHKFQPPMGSEDDSQAQQWPQGGRGGSEWGQVSPSISPISSLSDRQVLREMDNLPQVGAGRGISLTLPKADLDVSAGSLSTPPRTRPVKTHS